MPILASRSEKRLQITHYNPGQPSTIFIALNLQIWSMSYNEWVHTISVDGFLTHFEAVHAHFVSQKWKIKPQITHYTPTHPCTIFPPFNPQIRFQQYREWVHNI